MNALAALVRKDLYLYFSNRRALLVTLVAPILIAAFFGAVLGSPPKKPARVPIAVTDLDQSPVSRKIVAAMQADATFQLEESDEAPATARVREGKVRAAFVIPKGFGDAAPKAMFRPDVAKPAITVRFDPSQAIALALVKGLLAQHVMQSVSQATFGAESGLKMIADAREEVRRSGTLAEADRRDLSTLFESIERLQVRGNSSASRSGMPAGGFTMPFETVEQEVTSGERKYNGFAHSFAGMGVQFVLFMGIELGVAVLLMRKLGMWKRLRAAPVSRRLLLGSRIASGTIIAASLMFAIYAVAIPVFGVRIDGSVPGFVGVTLAFALLASTFGLLIAALGRTPEATRGLAILATLLLVMLGGAWVPSFVFPEWLQTATLVVPTRWAIDGLEAMTWRGLGLQAAYAPIGVMLAYSALFAAVGLRQFRWEE